MDRDFGLIHVRLQTWFPMQLQVYVNGHEWLARKLTRHGIRYTKQDNAFLGIEDFPRAQHFADRFVRLGWMALLDRYPQRVNPLLRDVLAPMRYYWVTTQSEYATDLVFKRRADLVELAPREGSEGLRRETLTLGGKHGPFRRERAHPIPEHNDPVWQHRHCVLQLGLPSGRLEGVADLIHPAVPG
jgi:hypothetical protein